MDKRKIILNTVNYIKNLLEGEGSGHDWWHIVRVIDIAKNIYKKENKGDIYIVEMGALLHESADWKLNKSEAKGLKKVSNYLDEQKVDLENKDKIMHIIENISFSKSIEGNKINSIEGYIVQDADRLDGMGAIGIARAFMYGGKKSRLMYHPFIKPNEFKSTENYRNSNSTTINHFYEKLLLLKDRMNTETGKKMAEERHKFMEVYLDQFMGEWNGKR